MFENYWYRGAHLSKFCLYTYFVTILVIKRAKSSEQIFEFEEKYPHKLNLIQKYYMKSSSNFLVVLIGNLS